ncbi:uncharacterized protein LOC113793345 [Dermatophagoides pteronyssinus]|uniref:uncharacterized protein LOC113793345 n=1 Tax=Dermatophagoides pteronyssinus TaxID=6956 RepID=UPI003F661AFF
MSYRKRRQSIYLQGRNSISRTNSYDGTTTTTGTATISSGPTTAGALSTTGTTLRINSHKASLLIDNFTGLPCPDLKTMKYYKGYEWVTFKPVEISPPALTPGTPNKDFDMDEQSTDDKMMPIVNDDDTKDKELSTTPEMIDYRITRLSKDWIEKVGIDRIGQQEIRDCLRQHVKQKLCHGSKAAKEMSIIDIHHSMIVRYSLESVCERRQLCWTFEPFVDHDDDDDDIYNGENPIVPYTSHSHQPVDDPWKIPVPQVRNLEVMIEQMTPSPLPPVTPSTPLPPIKESDDDNIDEIESVTVEIEKPRTVTFQTTIIDNKHHPLSQDILTSNKEEQAIRRKFQEKIFQDQCMEVTVPGTVSIHSCHICAGVGRKRCIACVGSGSTKCDICEGVGFYGIDHNKPAFTRTFSANSDNNDYCWRCRGRGRLRCDGCSGVGMTACIGCAGSGQIKCYIKMIVTLTNHHNTVITRDKYSCEIPFDQIKLTDGDLVLDEDGLDLHPSSLSLFHNDLINEQSERLIRLHRRKYLGNSRLIWQRHRIKVLPVCRVHSSWRGNRFRFYVFGRKQQRRCFTIDYPQRCFCIPCCCFCCCQTCQSPCRIA